VVLQKEIVQIIKNNIPAAGILIFLNYQIFKKNTQIIFFFMPFNIAPAKESKLVSGGF